MSNYYRCDISFMKDAEVGGRLYSGKINAEIPNGFIGYLGDYVSGSTEVRALAAPDATSIKGASLPVIVMKPEINYEDRKMSDRALGIFRNPANKPVPCIQFKEFDGVDLSEDYFDLTGKTNGKIEVGDIFAIQASAEVGKQLKYAATAPASTAAKCYFKVIGVKDSHIASFIDATGAKVPAIYKMVQLAIVVL